MWYLDFRTRDVGGPVASTPTLWHDEALIGYGLEALPVSDAGVTFVVHGFNNNRRDGVDGLRGFSAAAVAHMPALTDSCFVGVLWPGDAIVGFLSYPTEEADADRTANAFARALHAAPFARPPRFVAHSLGCRVLMQTLDLLSMWDAQRAWADQVVLLAAAVDNDVLARDDRYLDGTQSVARVVSVASSADLVLRFAFPSGDFLAALFSGGYTRGALGRHGPASRPVPPANVRPVQIPRSEDVGHGDYMFGRSDKQKRAAALAGRALVRDDFLRF